MERAPAKILEKRRTKIAKKILKNDAQKSQKKNFF